MNMTTKTKLLLIIAVFAFLFYISYNFFVVDQLTIIQAKNNELMMLQNQISRIETLPAIKLQLDDEIKIVEDERNRLKKYHFSLIQEQEEIILLVNEFLTNPALIPSVTFSSPNNETIGNNQVSSININMNYESTYPELLNILRTFWQFDRKIIITRIDMSLASDELLRGSFQLTLYDIAQITGELDRMFTWIDNGDDFKATPVSNANAPIPDDDRYKYIEP